MLTPEEAVTKYKEARAAYGYDISEFVNEPKHTYQAELERRALLAGDALDAAVCDAMLAAVEDCHNIECRPGIFREPPHPLSSCSACRSRATILAAFQRATGEKEVTPSN